MCGINFEYISGNDITADCAGATVGISCGSEVNIPSCDLLIAADSAGDCECAEAVFFEEANFAYNVYDCGDLQFIAKDGTITAEGHFSRKGALL